MSKKQPSSLQIGSIDRALQRHARVKKLSKLTTARARALLARESRETLVVASTADAAALALLRAEGQSYHVAASGETYLAPDEPEGQARRPQSAGPFARRASRIPRYLLLHPAETFSVGALTAAADVDKSVTSRVLAELARDALVRVEDDPVDARARVVSLADSRRLLEEWSRVWRRAHPASQRFNIGTRTAEETLRAIGDAHVQAPWAISGIAGAAVLRRAVEPADVLVLTTTDGVAEWKRNLLAEPDQDRGLLRIAVVDDEFIFRFARQYGKLVVADPVQLWLDTASAGERAAVAAEAVAEEMGW